MASLRRDALPCGLFLAVFAYILSGLCGTIPAYRDSGDLIAAAHTLGVAHPPGYAGYVLLAKLTTFLLPAASIAYRVNVLSALATAGAALFLFLSLRPLARDAGAAALALLWATMPAVVELGRVSEMYAPAACLAAATLYLSTRDGVRPRVAALFLWAISLSVHPVLLFLAPIPMAAYWAASEGEPPLRRAAQAGLALGLGLSLWLFLPLRAFQDPVVDWGHPVTWRNFWRVVTRADYGGLKLHPTQSVFAWTPESVMAQVGAFIRALVVQGGIVSVIAGAAGLVFAFRRRPTLAGWVAAFLLSGPLFFVLSNLPLQEPTTGPILQPYLVISGLVWITFCACAWGEVFETRKPAVRLTSSVCLLLATAWPALGRVPPISQRHAFYAYDYGRDLLRSLPPGAVLYDPDDPTAFTLRALQTTEGRREDVVLLNFFRTRWGYEMMRRRWPDLLPAEEIPNAQYLQAVFWSYSILRRPFFVELPQKLEGIPYRSRALVYQVRPSEGKPDFDAAERLWHFYGLRPGAGSASLDFFTRHVVDYYAAGRTNLGLEYAGAGRPEDALRQYRAALRLNPSLAVAYNNWGVIEYQRGRYDASAALYAKALSLDPDNRGYRENLALAAQAGRR